MRAQSGQTRWLFRSICIVLMTGALLASRAASVAVIADGGFGNPVPGQHVYDMAGLLTTSEVAGLEARARAVEQTGPPVVVYLRTRPADQAATQKDGRDLMQAWNVESSKGARDGLVIFLNLKPSDPHHGQAALIAGQKQVHGNLPERELQRIFDQEMKPLLTQGQTAAGIGAGLDAAAHTLVAGPAPAPPPSAARRAAADFARLPMNILALLLAGGMAYWLMRLRQGRPSGIATSPETVTPPGDLSPALAGALVARTVGDGQLEATILDFGRRGGLAIEPEAKSKVRVRLLDASVPRSPFEQAAWTSLAAQAGSDGIVPAKKIAKVRRQWKSAREALRADLRDRGWFDPAVPPRRRPLSIAGAVILVLACGTVAVTGVGKEPLGFIAYGLLMVAGITALWQSLTLPESTAEGERVAAPWRGYLAGLRAAGKGSGQEPNLDEAMPYLVGMNATKVLDKQLKAASARGYTPAWLGLRGDTTVWAGGFYPYWVAFHSGFSPSTSGSGVGAAAGSGAAGGGF